jgi:hypothetical protein
MGQFGEETNYQLTSFIYNRRSLMSCSLRLIEHRITNRLVTYYAQKTGHCPDKNGHFKKTKRRTTSQRRSQTRRNFTKKTRHRFRRRRHDTSFKKNAGTATQGPSTSSNGRITSLQVLATLIGFLGLGGCWGPHC